MLICFIRRWLSCDLMSPLYRLQWLYVVMLYKRYIKIDASMALVCHYTCIEASILLNLFLWVSINTAVADNDGWIHAYVWTINLTKLAHIFHFLDNIFLFGERYLIYSLQRRHNGCDGVSNQQPHDCLLRRLFRRRSKKTSKLCVTGLCAANSPGPVTRQMFPFDDVIMYYACHKLCHYSSCRHGMDSCSALLDIFFR